MFSTIILWTAILTLNPALLVVWLVVMAIEVPIYALWEMRAKEREYVCTKQKS